VAAPREPGRVRVAESTAARAHTLRWCRHRLRRGSPPLLLMRVCLHACRGRQSPPATLPMAVGPHAPLTTRNWRDGESEQFDDGPHGVVAAHALVGVGVRSWRILLTRSHAGAATPGVLGPYPAHAGGRAFVGESQRQAAARLEQARQDGSHRFLRVHHDVVRLGRRRAGACHQGKAQVRANTSFTCETGSVGGALLFVSR